MALIDLDKFVASFITEMKECSQMRNFSIPRCIKKALEDQGLEYKNGEIVKTQCRISAENEEMINEIINTVTGHHPTHSSKEIQKMVDWLEQQKGKQEIKPIWKHWKDGIAGNGEGKQIYLIKNGNSYTLSSCLGYECDYIELSELNRLLEKQGKQKSTNKVEPKFKVGDWIVSDKKYTNNVHRLCKVVGISDGCYIVQTIDGLKCFNTFKEWERDYHLIRWKQENVEELSDFESAMMHIGSSFFGENAGLDPNDSASIKEQAELLLELAPKTEWSEEDVSMIDETLFFIDEFQKSDRCKSENEMQNSVTCRNFLKSLKERMKL